MTTAGHWLAAAQSKVSAALREAVAPVTGASMERFLARKCAKTGNHDGADADQMVIGSPRGKKIPNAASGTANILKNGGPKDKASRQK